MDETILVTCESAPNIALIKYWGKKNESLILPLNGSISITLDKNVLCTRTSLLLRKNLSDSKKIHIYLNGQKQVFDDSQSSSQQSNEGDLLSRKRFFTMLNKVRENSEKVRTTNKSCPSNRMGGK